MNSAYITYTIECCKNHLDSATRQLETLINHTPTGEKRNLLCDANIHLAEAMRLFTKADEEAK